MKIGETDAIKN